tara:strand:- start:497 stop:850 length:354 start_codon:yes stop_codon:yes gene_type:complete
MFLVLLESGDALLLENGSHLLLEGTAPAPCVPDGYDALLLESGSYLLDQDGCRIALEPLHITTTQAPSQTVILSTAVAWSTIPENTKRPRLLDEEEDEELLFVMSLLAASQHGGREN